MNLIKRELSLVNAFLKKRREWLGGSYREYAQVGAFFAALTIIYTNFVAFNINTQIFTTYAGDGSGGFLWYNFAQPGLHLFLGHSDMVGFPYGENIGGPQMITYMAVWLPLRLLSFFFGPIAAANIFMILGFSLSAVSMYWLLKRLTGSVSVSMFAGFAVAFTPYAINKSLDHVPYILSYVFVFIMAGFIALWTRPTILRAVFFGVAIAAAFYTDGYYILLSSVLVFGLVVSGILYSLYARMKMADIFARIKMLSVAALVLVALLSPILLQQLLQGSEIRQSLEGRRSNIASELQLYRANVIDFLLPDRENPLLKENYDYRVVQDYKNTRSSPSESTNYIGYVIIFGSVLGLVTMVLFIARKKLSSVSNLNSVDQKKAVLLFSVFVILTPLILSFMFSPYIIVLGHRIDLPGQLLVDHNIALWRVLSRFFVPLHVVWVLFAAYSLWIMVSTSRILTRMSSRKANLITALIFTVLGGILALEYATSIHRPSYDFRKLDKGYYWLQKQHDVKTVLELPIVDPLDRRTADYVTAQIVHGKKLLNAKEDTTSPVTNVLGGIENPEVIDWAFRRGAETIVTHNTTCRSVGWGDIVYREDNDKQTTMCIYRLRKPISGDYLFLEFDKGFLRRPNAENQEVIIVESGAMKFKVADDRFSMVQGAGPARFDVRLERMLKDGHSMKWSMTQDNMLIAEGVLSKEPVNVSVSVDVRKPLSLRLHRSDAEPVQPGELTLSKAIVTRLGGAR